jgi:hypothetical protein
MPAKLIAAAAAEPVRNFRRFINSPPEDSAILKVHGAKSSVLPVSLDLLRVLD